MQSQRVGDLLDLAQLGVVAAAHKRLPLGAGATGHASKSAFEDATASQGARTRPSFQVQLRSHYREHRVLGRDLTVPKARAFATIAHYVAITDSPDQERLFGDT